jgi:hypothetical protein
VSITGRHRLISFGGAVVATLWLVMASPALAQLSFDSGGVVADPVGGRPRSVFG